MLVAVVLLGTAGCIAPLARTSANDPGFSMEFGGGLSQYRGHVLIRDTTTTFGYRVNRRGINAGPYGAARIGYGIRRDFGIDLTLAGAWGPPISRDEEWAGWLEAVLGFKYRPFGHNNLFFAELGYPAIAFGWTAGFPMNRPDEQWSLTTRIGGSGWQEDLPEEITFDWLAGLLPPTALQFSLSRNISHQRGRMTIMPQIGLGLDLQWTPLRANLAKVIAGVSLSPRLHR